MTRKFCILKVHFKPGSGTTLRQPISISTTSGVKEIDSLPVLPRREAAKGDGEEDRHIGDTAEPGRRLDKRPVPCPDGHPCEEAQHRALQTPQQRSVRIPRREL